MTAIQGEATPYVVYDAEQLASNYHQLVDYLRKHYADFRIFYPLKTCYLKPVVTWLANQGCGLNVVSGAERAIGRSLEMNSQNILWGGAAISSAHIRRAVKNGESINLDSEYYLDLALQTVDASDLGLRLCAQESSRFGIDPDLIEAWLKEGNYIRWAGMSFHVDATAHTGIDVSLEHRLRLIGRIGEWEKTYGLRIGYIDIGGGIRPEYSLEENLQKIISAVSALESNPTLYLEPGSWLVDNIATAYTTVVNAKRLRGKRWLTVDLGHNFLVPLERASFVLDCDNQNDNELVEATGVGGPGYERNILRNGLACAMEVGDIIPVKQCGAYTESIMSCSMNPPPTIYWRNGEQLEKVLPLLDSDKCFLNFHGFE